MGKIFEIYEPAAVSRYRSRGYESPTSKYLMRFSVLLSELLTLIPAAVLFFLQKSTKLSKTLKMCQLTLALNLPPFILIDHGHFQYNCVMLGLTLAAIVAISKKRIWLGSMFFVLALNFKQMGLYYALPMFFGILGFHLRPILTGSVIQRAKSIIPCVSEIGITGLVVIASFGVNLMPWLFSMESAKSVLSAVFPFQRGLYHLKVASVWCVTNPLFDWNV